MSKVVVNIFLEHADCKFYHIPKNFSFPHGFGEYVFQSLVVRNNYIKNKSKTKFFKQFIFHEINGITDVSRGLLTEEGFPINVSNVFPL